MVLRLPRLVEADPRSDALAQNLSERAKPLRDGSDFTIVDAEFDPALQKELRTANLAGRVVRGAGEASKTLANEARGLRLVDENTGVSRGVRVSRLLLISADGSDGFYRGVERLLRTHGPRVLAIRLDVGAEELGAPLFGHGSTTRLLMLQHKESVAAVLLACADQFVD